MGDGAPIVFDGDGNPMRIRMVGAECEGDVSGEGHYAFIPQEQEARESPTVYFETADAPDLLTAVEVLGMVSDRIDRLEDAVGRAERQYDNPDCPHCDRKMSIGSIKAGEITYGCYPGGVVEYDCPYYQEHGHAYTVGRTIRDVAPLRRELRAMEELTRRIESELEAADG